MIHLIQPCYPFDSNSYLITGDRNFLIDAGTGLNSEYLSDSVRRIIGTDGVLDGILLTHCHADHIGGVPYLVQVFGCKVYAGYADAEAIRLADDRYTLASDFDLMIPSIPVEDIHQDDMIDIGEHRFRVIETPGHTKGGVCFYDEISQSLFSGDTVFTNGVGRTDFNGGSVTALRNSIKYLIAMAVKDMYPGHGRPTNDGHAAIMRGLQVVGD